MPNIYHLYTQSCNDGGVRDASLRDTSTLNTIELATFRLPVNPCSVISYFHVCIFVSFPINVCICVVFKNLGLSEIKILGFTLFLLHSCCTLLLFMLLKHNKCGLLGYKPSACLRWCRACNVCRKRLSTIRAYFHSHDNKPLFLLLRKPPGASSLPLQTNSTVNIAAKCPLRYLNEPADSYVSHAGLDHNMLRFRT